MSTTNLPPLPDFPADRLATGTTTADGRSYAMLYCVPCGRYAYNVSSRGIRSRMGDLFRPQDLAIALAAAASHECPPEVRNAQL